MSNTAHLINLHQRELDQVRARQFELQRRDQELQTILATLQAVMANEVAAAAAANAAAAPPPAETTTTT